MPDEKPVILSGSGLTKVFGFGRQNNLSRRSCGFQFLRGRSHLDRWRIGQRKDHTGEDAFGIAHILRKGRFSSRGKSAISSSHKKKKEYWKNIQAIFQDPFSSYNTFHKIDAVLLDCIRMRGGGKLPKEKKVEMMTEACSFVNLKFAELTNKYPFELSGGQMQRLMIARIFLLKPKILLADEPTSMIDACCRATILDYLMQLRNEVGMTVIFITHDIGLAYYVSDSVYIMEHGKIVENGSADEVILHPKEPYTRRLISDVPKIYEEWDLSTVEYSS